jgi:hypothetical protein
MRNPSILAFCAVALAACGFPAPNTVELFVGTFPPGASCAVIHNGHVVGQIEPTPGIALVPNEERDYLVTCNRRGFDDVSAVVHARAETRSLWQKLGSTEISAPGGASISFALIPRQRLR